MPPVVDLSPTIVGHEDRLQRVESNLQDVAVNVGQIGVKVDNLASAIHGGIADLKANDTEVISRLERHAKEIADHGARLKPLEEHHKGLEVDAKKRKDRIKGALIATLLAGAGAFITKAVEVLWAKW